MTPSEQIAHFLSEVPTGKDVTIPVPGGETILADLFTERVTLPCTRCGVAACWQRVACPAASVRAFARLIYHCPTCRGDAGFYLLVRWAADRSALIIRKVAQFLPPGRNSASGA